MAEPNTLTDQEKQEGWELLFDGTSAEKWVGFQTDALPEEWQAKDGTLAWTGKGGDIVTRDTYDDFDLLVDWKISEGGNSGIFFWVTDAYDAVWKSGPEQQIIDNDRHPDGKNPKTMVGSLYALIPPTGGEDVTNPVGEWNTARIRAVGPLVTYWLNGHELLSFDASSNEFKALVAESKFGKFDFAKVREGRIALQDHGDPVWFRNIKIRRL